MRQLQANLKGSHVAKADFAANGDYTFSYDGTAMHAMAAAEEKKKGSLREKDPMMQSAEYLGHGRYQLKLLVKKKRAKT